MKVGKRLRVRIQEIQGLYIGWLPLSLVVCPHGKTTVSTCGFRVRFSRAGMPVEHLPDAATVDVELAAGEAVAYTGTESAEALQFFV